MTRFLSPVPLAVALVAVAFIAFPAALHASASPDDPLQRLVAEAEAAGLASPEARSLADAVAQSRVRRLMVQTEDAILRASNAEANDTFGYSVSISGDRALVGALSADSPGGGVFTGAAYIYDYDAGTDTWTESAIISASNADPGDSFGVSVSLSGDRALVGAWNEDGPDDDINGAGAAYVFDYDAGTDTWSETTILRASNIGPPDDGGECNPEIEDCGGEFKSGMMNGDAGFGFSVSLSGDRALIGAVDEDGPNDDESNLGAAYVFDYDGGTDAWTETTILRASNGEGGSINGVGDRFGFSVALDGDFALIGAIEEDGPGNVTPGAGAAYVFALQSGSWTETTVLRASNAEGGDDAFGHEVVLSDSRALIAAIGEDGVGNAEATSGAAYVFDYNAGADAWTESAILRGEDTESGDQFGISIALSGDRAIVGARYDDGADNTATDAGAAYVFELVNGTWEETDLLRASNANTGPDQFGNGDNFGASVALDGNRAIVGADEEDGPSNADEGSGAVYTYEFAQAQTLSATLTGAQAYRMLTSPTGGSYDDLLGSIWTQGFPGSDNASGGCSVFRFDETVGDFATAYTCLADQNATFARGSGAFVFVYADDDLNASGVQGGFPKTLTATDPGYTDSGAPFMYPGSVLTYTDNADTPAAEEGFNLLGNPLTAAFDWDDAIRGGGLTETIYVYDPNYLGGQYRTWSAGVGGDLPDGVVPAFQGFFAKAIAANPTLEIPLGAVVDPGPGVYGKDAPNPLRLEVSQDGTPVSVGFVAVSPEAALGDDVFDALRLTPLAWPRTVLSTRGVGEDAPLALNALPAQASGEMEIPLEIATEGYDAGPLAMSLAWSGALPDGWTATLVDRDLGTATDLAPGGSYAFDVTSDATKSHRAGLGLDMGLAPAKTGTASSTGSRFVLRITPASVTNTGETPEAAFSLGAPAPNPSRGTVRVPYTLATSGEARVSVLDALGREVAILASGAHGAGAHEATLDAASLAPGVYVVRLSTAEAASVRRITVVR